MDKKKQIQFNLNNFLLSTSTALDLVEKHKYKIVENHSKRVAFLSLKLGEKIQLAPQEMADLCSYCLVHNIALTHAQEDSKEYYELAQEYTKDFPFLCGYANILKYHNEFLDGSGIFGIKGKDIPLLSQILCFSHTLDRKFNLSGKEIENRKEIISFLEEKEDILFSKEIVDVFLDIASTVDFWLDLQNENDILYYIFATLYDFTITPSFEEVLKITTPFEKLINDDASFLNICEKMTSFYEFEHKDKQTFLIAASLHNIGKLAIPNEIINKNESLNENEYEVIKSYPYYTKKVLSNLMGFNDITNWACRVQETIDGSGYPFKLSGKDLSLKDRLMAILNIYHSLTNKKPYREAFSHEEAVSIMLEKANAGELDRAIVKDIAKELK